MEVINLLIREFRFNQMDSYITGLSCIYNDSAVTLIEDGEIVTAVQEESFSIKKYGSRFPINSIKLEFFSVDQYYQLFRVGF